MINWCCYCNTFIEQIEPLDDFRVSHGICPKCAEGVMSGEIDGAVDERVNDFYRDIFRLAKKGREVEVSEVMARAQELDVQQSDLYLGILQPLLWRIGQVFEAGRITVEQEHLFSESVQKLLVQFGEAGVSPPVQAVLFPAAGNTHTIGINFLCRLLLDRVEIKTTVIDRGPNGPDELSALLSRYQPNMLGISAALPEHAAYIADVARWMEELTPGGQCRLLAGGPAVAVLGTDPAAWGLPADAEICAPSGVLGFLQNLKGAAAPGAPHPA